MSVNRTNENNKLIMNDYKLIKNTGQDMTFIKNK